MQMGENRLTRLNPKHLKAKMSNYGNTPHVPTEAELSRKASGVIDQAENRLAKQFEVKDGKFLGIIPIPEELERTFGLIIGPITTSIAGGAGNFAGKVAESLLKTSFFDSRVKDKGYAINAAKTAGVGLLLGSRVLMEGYAFTRDRSLGYLDIVRETKQIGDEVGASADNKMMKLSFKKYNESWGRDIKKLIPGVVQLVSMMPYAAQEYNKIWDHPLWQASHEAPVVKRSKTEVMDDWNKNHAPNYTKAKGFDAEERKEYRAEFMAKHGFATLNSQNNAHAQNAPFNIEDLLTGKTGWKVALPALAGFAGPDFERWASKDDKKKSEKLNSFEMVEELRDRVKKGSIAKVHEAVISIFEQFELDMGHKEFSSPQLAERTQVIAKAIISGKMSALGLLRLVGEDMVVIHSGSTRELKSEEDIAKAVNMVSAATLSKSSEMSQDKFLGRYEGSSVPAAIVQDTIRKNLLEFKEGPERDFFVSLMPLEILEHTGLGKKDIRESRGRAQTHVYEHVAAAVLHLASLEEKYLTENGMTFKEVQYLKGLSKRILTGDMDTLRELVDNKKEGLTTLVAAGLLAEQSDRLKGGKETWSERVKEGANLKGTIDKILQKKSDAAAEKTHAPHEKPAHHEHDSHDKVELSERSKHGIEPKSHMDHAKRKDTDTHLSTSV